MSKLPPGAVYSFPAFVHHVLSQGTITLEVRERREVASGCWYVLRWMDEQGQERTTEGQTLTIALRRASEAQAESEAQSEWAAETAASQGE